MSGLEKPEIGAPCNGCGVCCQAQICSLGSITMGLVKIYGERAQGPCPALKANPEGGFACNLVLRPKDYRKGAAHELRAAAATLIGAGIGCDEAGDDPDADHKLKAMQETYIARVGRHGINRAVATWFGVSNR